MKLGPKLPMSTENLWVWWPTPLTPALRRQSQADLCESEASLVYRVSHRIDRADTQKNPVSEKQYKMKTNNKKEHREPTEPCSS